jgi:hypothetical protein
LGTSTKQCGKIRQCQKNCKKRVKIAKIRCDTSRTPCSTHYKKSAYLGGIPQHVHQQQVKRWRTGLTLAIHRYFEDIHRFCPRSVRTTEVRVIAIADSSLPRKHSVVRYHLTRSGVITPPSIFPPDIPPSSLPTQPVSSPQHSEDTCKPSTYATRRTALLVVQSLSSINCFA